jgi:hypothetical protein
LTGEEVAKRFANRDLGTGGKPPYTALIRTDGEVEQMLPLIVAGQHCAGYNWCSWSVAVVGRYHEVELPDHMLIALVETLAILAVLPRKMDGHTELDKRKKPNCPGSYIDMALVRSDVANRLPSGSDSWGIRRRLEYIARAGFTI